jgi:hypothetical protein
MLVTLDHILGSDFVHVVSADHFLTKQEHIDWVVQHPQPKNLRTRFGKRNVRLYGDVGIVNGSVISTDHLRSCHSGGHALEAKACQTLLRAHVCI